MIKPIVFLQTMKFQEKTHYSCIAVIYFDSVLTLNEENCPQVYLEQCKY